MLWAKALLSLGVVLVLTEIASFIAFLGGQAAPGAHGTTISAPGALRAVVGTGLYLTVVAVIGTGLGFMLRSTAGGIATLVGILLVLPGLMSVLPQSWQDTITNICPAQPALRCGICIPSPPRWLPGPGLPWPASTGRSLWPERRTCSGEETPDLTAVWSSLLGES